MNEKNHELNRESIPKSQSPLVRFELPPPKSGNIVLRDSVRKRSKENSDWGWTLLATLRELNIQIPKQNPSEKRYFVFYLESPNPQDDNNFHISIKGLLDEFQEGRVANAIINDSVKNCRVFYAPVKVNRRQRRLFVELYERTAFMERIHNDKEFENLIFS